MFKKQLIKSFIGVGAMKLLSIPVGLLTSVILARMLGPQQFGQYVFIISILSLLVLPVSGGMPQLLTREITLYLHSNYWGLYKGALRASHLWVIYASISIFCIGFTMASFTDALSFEGKWFLLAIGLFMVPINGLNEVRNGIIKGTGFPAFAEFPNLLVQPVLLLAVYSVMAYSGSFSLNGAVGAQVGVAAATYLIASWMFYKLQPARIIEIKPEYQLKKWVKLLFPFTCLAIVSAINAQIGILMLGFLGTDEQVAAMRIAERGGQLIVLSLTLMNLVIAPYIVRAYRGGDVERLQKLAQQSARVSLIISAPIAIILFLFGRILIEGVFGDGYADLSFLPLGIIVIGQLINVFFGSVGYLLSMSGFEKDALVGQFLATGVNVILCVILVPSSGAVGASIAVSTGTVAWNMFLAYSVWRRMKIRSMAF